MIAPGRNTRPIQQPSFGRPSTGRPGGGNNNWWNSGNIGSGNRVNININNNFRHGANWSTNRKNWGYSPWWNRPATRPWYGGSWHCGWRPGYHPPCYRPPYYGYRPPGYVVYDSGPSTGEMIAWGLVGWGLGKLIFDSGYSSYSNPYPAQPVPTTSGAPVTYNQPITVVAADTAPADDAAAAKVTEASEGYVVKSQQAFKQKDYLAALDAINKAIAEAPGDGALHEYRALVQFALAKYSEAAGVLNPVLASGPGWDWTTMVKLYDSQETYTGQLEALAKYSALKPDAADAHFLLGYHYMVCAHLELAEKEFAAAAKLQPADTVSSQLADLCKASSTSAEEDAAPKDGAAPAATPAETPPPEPVPVDQLAGTWVSDRGDAGKITLVFKSDGNYTWNFVKDGKSTEFGGEFSMNDDGFLVMGADESQMVADVSLPKDKEMKFVLTGGPPGDPGLDFKKS